MNRISFEKKRVLSGLLIKVANRGGDHGACAGKIQHRAWLYERAEDGVVEVISACFAQRIV